MRISDWSSDVCSSDLGGLSAIAAYNSAERAAVQLDTVATPHVAPEFVLIGKRPLHAFLKHKVNPSARFRAGRRIGVVGAAQHAAVEEWKRVGQGRGVVGRVDIVSSRNRKNKKKD